MAAKTLALATFVSLVSAFAAGAEDPFAVTTDRRAGYDWWSLQPLRDVKVPEPARAPAEWLANPIDRFVFAALAAKGLSPSPSAEPRVLIRRATYDLTGLPPTPAEIDAFVAACAEETGSDSAVGDAAYAALIDRLLASPHYGERWGRHWLDVVRFGESTGFEVNHIIDNLWPYRDYIINSFNEDKPVDQLILEQLAGDAVDYGNPEVEIGMAFLVAGPWDIVGNQDPVAAAQIRANTIDEMVRATSEAFLGLTVGCARCHDHKFDPISQRDYYRMYATFASVYHDDRIVATEEERTAYAEAIDPLNAEREQIRAERAALVDAIVARGEEAAATYEAKWTRAKIERTGTEELFDPVEAKHLRLVAEGRDTDPNARTGFRIDEFEVWTAEEQSRNVAAAANGGAASGRTTTPEDFAGAYSPALTIDGKFGAKWIAHGPELTITFAQPETIHRVFFSSDRPNALGDFREAAFVSEYRIEVSMDGETWTEVANSYDRAPVNDAHRRKRLYDAELTDEDRKLLAELDAAQADIDKRIAAIPSLPRLRTGRLEQPEGPFHIFKGGDPQRPGDAVVPASLDVLSQALEGYALPKDAAERQRRLALAEWIVDDENPLTPRVLANRLWHYHFGAGIVATPSDFGYMGGEPSHPKLLDWLAQELLEPTALADEGQPWQLKRMHRLIMSSQTYRQSSRFDAQAAAVDGANRLLWRFPPRRLTAEEIRDTMLTVAGKLDREMGGPGFRLYRYLRDNVSTYVPLDEYGPETYRRSVYHQNVRASRVDLMTDFDAPDCALPAPRRVTTTSPLQALTLMNHSFTLDMAESLAERLVAEADSPAKQITRAFELTFSRAPNQNELEQASKLVADHGLAALCRGLFNANEFVYLD